MDQDKVREAVFSAHEALRSGRHLLITTTGQLLGSHIYDKNTPIGRVVAEMEAAEKKLWEAVREVTK
jgi:hypothetical protein